MYLQYLPANMVRSHYEGAERVEGQMFELHGMCLFQSVLLVTFILIGL